MVGSTCFGGVIVLALVAPFELTAPLVRLPGQSVSNVEVVVLCACVSAAAAFVWSRRLGDVCTPLTLTWAALLVAMAVASVMSPVSRVNAFHMTGRAAAALGVFVIASHGMTTPRRFRIVLALVVGVGVLVSVLAILEYGGVRPVLKGLEVFRPFVSTVGAQVRAGGPLQYPTIASMYLEVVFALGLGLMLREFDAERYIRVAALFVALAAIAEAITLSFTRAGLITLATSLLLVGVLRRIRRRTAGTALLGSLAASIAILAMGSRPAESLWLRLTSEGQESWYRANIDAAPELILPPARLTTVPLKVTNTGRLPWDSQATPPMLLSYHWLQADGDRFVTFEGERTPFAAPVRPDTTVSMAVQVRAPRRPGRYRIEWDIVQEGRLWFSTEPGAARAMSQASVEGDPGDADMPTTPPPRRTVRPGRGVLWRAAARMFSDHPLTGVGPDNFRLAYGSYAGLAGADERTHSNNMYLEVLAGGGLIVGAVFGWLLWQAGFCAIAICRRQGTEPGAAALGVAAALLAIAVHASVDSFLSFAPTYVLFSLTLGCAVACARGLETWPDANRL